ncbi:MAG: helix-turn-helix domain-containing protein [Clostridiaceae bacterium]|nr:helix-turn-helix domain-containing protein [Clostridiaceae bacterium]
MPKKENLSENAERLYVIDRMTINEVADRIGVNERTIRRWKTQYNWENKKKQYLDTKSMFHEDLFNFSRKLMTSIEYDMDNGVKVDPGRMFAFTKTLPLITKIKEYEDAVAKKGTEENKPSEISPDFIKQINEEFLGIKYDE